MDNQEIRTLRLLEEFDKEDNPSQRALARQLNVSLGLVNSFIKRLARKGYFKITNLPANRVAYILTPKGAAEKTRLTCEYIQYSFQYYRQTKAKLQKLFAALEQQEVSRLVFWGIGELAEIAYVALQETSMDLVGVVDEKAAGRKFLGMKVQGPDDLEELDFDRIVITGTVLTDSLPDALVQRQEVAGLVVVIG